MNSATHKNRNAPTKRLLALFVFPYVTKQRFFYFLKEIGTL